MEGVLRHSLQLSVPEAHITELSPDLEQCQETGDAVDFDNGGQCLGSYGLRNYLGAQSVRQQRATDIFSSHAGLLFYMLIITNLQIVSLRDRS